MTSEQTDSNSPDRAVRKRKGLIATIVTTLGFMGLVLFFMMVNYERHPKVVLPFYMVKIDDRLFCIPKPYLDYPPMDPEGFLATAYMPDYQPGRSTINVDGKKRLNTKFVMILAEPIATYVPYDEVYKNHVKNYNATREVGKVYGLTHYTHPPGTRNTDADDMFVEKNGRGDVQSFINCKKNIGGDSYPLCTHDFIQNKVFYKIDYGMENLPEWKTIQEKVTGLVDGFECEVKNNVVSKKGFSK